MLVLSKGVYRSPRNRYGAIIPCP
ncbi:hypothetical protein NC651_016605 [Populus alba x Populus x berolinensis]|nr:hypothetical protein NC651_016605 [Populus alba x Populus x berolinensis]